MATVKLKNLLNKRPFYEVLPTRNERMERIGIPDTEVFDTVTTVPVTQADFLRQYWPSGHAINDHKLYPDIYKQDPDTKKWYIQPIDRVAFAFQQIIATKQVMHLVGNDIQFELAEKASTPDAENRNVELLMNFITGWAEKNMEVQFYDAVRSYKITGDCATVGYFDRQKKFRVKALSYLNGDTLYPHYDEYGDLDVFMRKYTRWSDDRGMDVETVEAWDDTWYYLCELDEGAEDTAVGISTPVRGYIATTGYKVVRQQRHGFPFIPVAYARCETGACWSPSQATIEEYEESFSYLTQSNKAFALPIMYIKGDGVSLAGDMNGSVKAITMNEDGEAGFLNRQDVSSAYNTQLNTLYKMIYEQSFTVTPPEVKAGDLPGVAIKLLYSPALEKATCDAHDLDPYLQGIVRIVKFGYGMEIGKSTQLTGLKIHAWIKPYVHQNDTEVITNLATCVQNKFLSRQTASERTPEFPKNDEFDRIMREEKEKEQADLLTELRKQDNQTENNIELEEARNAMTVKTGNGSASKGFGNPGRKNMTGREYDENGNWDGRMNWDRWNRTH